MSQPTAVRVARPTPRPSGRTVSPRLRVVSAPAGARSRAGLVVGCLTLLGVGLVGLLLLNVSLEQGAFVRRQQQSRLEQLVEQRAALTEELAALEAPQSLAGRAEELGMVEAPNAAFVRTSDGQILGVPSPGVANPAPDVTLRKVPVADRGTTAGPAASLHLTEGTTAGPAEDSTKVTATGKATATTTARPGTSAAPAAGTQ